MQGSDLLASGANTAAMARPASQQQSVRRHGTAAAAAAAGGGDGTAESGQGKRVYWWKDPKLTFGPPGDPDFLAQALRQHSYGEVSHLMPRLPPASLTHLSSALE